MLERLVEQRRVITDVMLDTSVTKKSDACLLLRDAEWESISELSSVLCHLTKVTTYMSTESCVSASVTYPIVCGLLKNHLNVGETDSPSVIKVKETIASALKSRFYPDDIKAASSASVISSFLDPRHKHLSYLSSVQRKSVDKTIDSLLDDIPLKPSVNEECAPKKPKVQRVLDFLIDDCQENVTESEIDLYKRERVQADVNPLDWWRSNSSKYPRLSILARRYLAIPGTSVPSERIFSKAGLILSKLRNRLSSSCVDRIIFLNKNKLPVS
jgi:hypothetical protein